MCLAHRDDFEQVGRAAEAAGWMVAPDSLVPPFDKAIGKPKSWLHSSASGLEILAVGRMADSAVEGGPKITARFCGVGAAPPQTGVALAVQTLVAVPPNASGAKPGRVMFVYRHTSQGLAPITSDLRDLATIRKLQTPDVDFVQIDDADQATMLLMVVPEGRSLGEASITAPAPSSDAPPHR